MQLKHLPTGLVIKSQATRSRTQNRKIARDLLALKLDELAHGAQSRAAIVGETKRKRAASKAKKSRRKYRRLADGAEGAEVEGEGEGEEGEEGVEGEGESELEGKIGEGQGQREHAKGEKRNMGNEEVVKADTETNTKA